MNEQIKKQCTNCGNWTDNSAMFCPQCGSQTFRMPQPQQQQFQGQTLQPQFSEQTQTSQTPQPQFQSQPQPQQTQFQSQPQPDGGKKKNTKPLIIGGIAAVAVIALAVVLALALSGKKNTEPKPSGSSPAVTNADVGTEPAEAGDDASEPADASPVSSDKAVFASDSPVVFKQIGNVRDSSFRPGNIIARDDDGVVLSDPFGVNQLQKHYESYSAVDAAKGIYIVKSDAGEPNDTGLVNTNGKVYIPCETAGIKRINERFVRVFYGTKRVYNEDEGLFFITDRSFAMYYSEEAGDRLYAGYIRVYDLVDEKFLDNIKIEDPAYTIYGLTENFYIYNRRTRVSTVYGADGQEITGFPALGSLTSNVDYVQAKVGEETVVYDQNANVLFRTAEKGLYKVFNGKYYSKHGEDDYLLCNSDGTQITKKEYRSIESCGELFLCKENRGDESYYGVLDASGNTVFPFEGDMIEKNSPCTGFLFATVDSDKKDYALIYPDGTYMKLDSRLENGSYCKRIGESDSYKVLIVTDRDYITLDAHSMSTVGRFCASVQNEEGFWYLMDTFSGKQLTEAEYTKITKGSNECIYAQRADDKSWDVFTIHENDYATAQRVKATLLNSLEEAFAREGIAATVDKATGEIALDSAVLFELDKSDLLDDGKEFLQKFVGTFTSVVFDGTLDGYVDSILIEGHTDSDGTLEHNLQLSQDRADVVKAYCLSPECGGARLTDMLTSVGVASERPVLNADGTENKEASRRVSFTLIIVTTEFESEGA